jgi:hypothetical protein
MVERKNVYKISVGKREEKMPLKDPRRRTGNNIDMDLTEIRQKGGDEIIRFRKVTTRRFLYMRLDEMWGLSGLREDVFSYGSGLREDPWHVPSYDTLSSMDLVRTFFFQLVSYYVNYGRKSERRNE